jgi:uncharacterized protein
MTTPADAPTEAARERLPSRALTAWRIGALALGVPVALALAALGVVVDELPVVARVALLVLPAIGVLADVLVIQPLRHRLWWYSIGDEEIELRRGWPVTTRTAVPVVRVQHVDVQQGPLARRFKLADLRVNTAAGPVRIPSLDRSEAERIRRRIAELARIPDEL